MEVGGEEHTKSQPIQDVVGGSVGGSVVGIYYEEVSRGGAVISNYLFEL